MTLRKTLNNFLRPLGIRAERANEWCAWDESKVIGYPKNKEGYYDENFMAHFTNKYPDIKCGEFVISVLHEVGHCFNPTQEIEHDTEILEQVSDGDLPFDTYFELPDEVAATEWAVKYIRTHNDEIEKLERKLNL